MLDHMLSSRAMHEAGKWYGEELVKHEVKKKNIAAVHVQYYNTLEHAKKNVSDVKRTKEN